ncbi:DUF3231 family protein [Peribacillus frigoritolerans]|uniref:DUF3231 family protein n=1 Tax=Peribacillus frigoritolerans TaxID=450367 RepID=UPI002B2458B3|nr:DUF3231 family protein [Peribacillus frigoritolerans]MEB2490428.1 DUF3231 family protein [Peribacillus frigoritolerans]
MGILSGNPKDEPMHYGEVFGTWAFLTTTKGLIACHQTMLNHTCDKDLHKLLVEVIDQGKQEHDQLESLLKENNVGLPPSPPERPKANLEDIPVGARLQDPEISASVSININAGLVACSQMMGQCIREDIAQMFAQFHTNKAALGADFLRLNKEKGWLVPPPLHINKTSM